MTAIVWFRRDLRLHEHPALRAALDHDEVIPVFCLDDRLLNGRHASGPRTRFMLECLHDLDDGLRQRGSRLVIRRGPPEQELAQLAAETGARELHFTADVTSYARARGERVAGAMSGVGLCPHPGLAVVDEPGGIRTQRGRTYTVLSPDHRAWLEAPRREVRAAPRALPALPARLVKGTIPSLDALGVEGEVAEPAPGGERAGRERMSAWLRNGVASYGDNHDALGEDRTSRLSPYLRFGCVSARELEERLPRGSGPDAFRRQLCWRDFYQHVILHHPRNARSEFQSRYRGTISWLLREGFMHNRARLVVGSFLTKDLGIDWRWGERWFMAMLLDGDEASTGGSAPYIGLRPITPGLLGSGSHPWGSTRSRRTGGSTTRRSTWSDTTPAVATFGATWRSCKTCPTNTCASRGRCPTSSSGRWGA